MPRSKRCIEPGAVYHLISRFVAKEWFIETDDERRRYLRLLGDQVVESDWRFFAFAAMSNHLHFGAVAGNASLASIFRPAHTAFAESINRDLDRIGGVFARGPRSIRVAEGGVARLIGYIHCNPVRAGVAEVPRDSTWTSHRAYLGVDAPPRWLDVKLGIELAGFHSASELDEWIEVTLSRGELATAHLEPARRRGRPRTHREKGSDPISAVQLTRQRSTPPPEKAKPA